MICKGIVIPQNTYPFAFADSIYPDPNHRSDADSFPYTFSLSRTTLPIGSCVGVLAWLPGTFLFAVRTVGYIRLTGLHIEPDQFRRR